jgi:hypothetical protein
MVRMKKLLRNFALSVLATAFGFLYPIAGHAQDSVYELSPAQLQRAMSQFSPNTVITLSPANPAPAQDQSPASRTVYKEDGTKAHLMPLARDVNGMVIPATDFGPLLNHGGPIMQPSVTIYPVFWVPAHLQTGAPTGMTTHYQAVQYYMLGSFLSHGLGSILTQYYQKSPAAFIQNKGGIGKAYLDTSPYPASGCSDPAFPGNCLSDAQIQAEVQKIMKVAGVTGGLDKIFMVFLSSNEGTCLNSKSCTYQFCGYHSYFTLGGKPVIYSNQPYGLTHSCQVAGAPSPNGNPDADTASTAASHELSEAMTDPKLNAWGTAQGNEIGDLCAYKYGPLTWDGGRANQMWNGYYFLVQTEFDNHAGGCYQVGP